MRKFTQIAAGIKIKIMSFKDNQEFFLIIFKILTFPVGILRKQRTFGDATTCFPAKWRQRKERRNSILMTRHHDYLELGSASDRLNQSSI